MWRRYGVSWRLVRSSWRVLWRNSDLLFFPLLTVVGASIMLGSFGWAMLLWLDFDIQRVVDAPAWVHVLSTFAWYLLSYAIGIYTNTALIAVVMRLFRGEAPDMRAGWRLATSRLPSIFGYALIMATIGVVLRYILRPAGILGRLVGPAIERSIIFAFVGLAWHIVPYFVVPVIISGERHPLRALKHSAGLIKRTWGNDVVVNASVWLIFTVPLLVVGTLAVPAVSWAVTTLSEMVVTVTVYALLLLVLLTLLFKMAMDGIFSAAVYEYATTGVIVEHFHEEDLQRAFDNRPSRFVNSVRRAGRALRDLCTKPFRRNQAERLGAGAVATEDATTPPPAVPPTNAA